MLTKAHQSKQNRLQTDIGTEFLNRLVQDVLKEKAIHSFASESERKAAMVEGFNRTLKTRMWNSFTSMNTDRYLDVLEELLEGYNHARHRTIGMSQSDVEPEHEEILWKRM